MQATLVLEDGTVLSGDGLGAICENIGEVVFNTAMSGYEEVITDPSYRGQLVLFTASHIGNTGITLSDSESNTMQALGMICKQMTLSPDNYRSQISIDEFLKKENKCAIYNIDTRYLTQKLRENGCMLGILSTAEHRVDVLKTRLKNTPPISDLDLVTVANPPESGGWEIGGSQNLFHSFQPQMKQKQDPQFLVAVLDFGVKNGILDSLHSLGCKTVLFSANASANEILAISPDGLFLSNGPGDPRSLASTTRVVETLKTLTQKLPTFGICLGHQLLGLTFGGEIRKLSFGHHAVNHPVVRIAKSKLARALVDKEEPSNAAAVTTAAMITSQNHNYVVEIGNLSDMEITHIHMNDQTIAGMRHKSLPIFSVQFHPESNPGPRDSTNLFAEFAQLMQSSQPSSGHRFQTRGAL